MYQKLLIIKIIILLHSGLCTYNPCESKIKYHSVYRTFPSPKPSHQWRSRRGHRQRGPCRTVADARMFVSLLSIYRAWSPMRASGAPLPAAWTPALEQNISWPHSRAPTTGPHAGAYLTVHEPSCSNPHRCANFPRLTRFLPHRSR